MSKKSTIIIGPLSAAAGEFGGIQTIMNAYNSSRALFLDNGVCPVFQESIINAKGELLKVDNKIKLIQSFGSSKHISSIVAQYDACNILVNSSRGLSLLRELRTIGYAQKRAPVRSFLYLHHANRIEQYLTGHHVIDREILDRLVKVDHLILLSKKTRDTFIRAGMVDEERCSVLYPFHTYELRQTRGSSCGRDNPRIIYMGHLYEQKGIIDLVESFFSLPSCFRLDICGDGDEGIKRYIINRSHDSDGRIIYHGVVTGDDKRRLYEQASIFCLPSYAEGLPVSMLEAMSFGCVPVVTDVGAISEVVTHESGVLVKPGDRESIARAVIFANTHWETMSDASVSISSHFTVENHIKTLCQILNKG